MADRQSTADARKEVQRSENAQGNQMARGSQSGGFLQRRNPMFMSPREFFNANPFYLMRRMTEEMDRMFEDAGLTRGQGSSGAWAPAIEIDERDGKYIVHAELPGLKPEDVKVEMTDDVLIIQGERKYEHEDKQGGTRRTERRYGEFYRAIALPEGVNPEEVHAKFENGVLEVSVPVPQQQQQNQPRQIPIEGSSGGSQQPTGTSQQSTSQTGGQQHAA